MPVRPHTLRPRLLATLVAIAVGLTGRVSHAEAAPRVLVLDMVLKGVVGGDASELPDLIGLKLAKRRYRVISSGEHHRALYETPGLSSDCERRDDCRLKLARALKADLVLATKLSKDKKQYLLEFEVLPTNEGKRKQASETMRKRESLPMNVDLCLTRLFEVLPVPPEPIAPPEPPPAPAVVPSPVVPAIAPPPTPVAPPEPERPPQATDQCSSDRDCARLSGTASSLPRECLAESWRGFPQNTCVSCVEGFCGCPPGRNTCGQGVGCVDLRADPEHCGHCDRRCADGAACVKGECR